MLLYAGGISIGFEQMVYIFQEGTTGNEVCIIANDTVTPDMIRISVSITSKDISASSKILLDHNIINEVKPL